MGAPKNYSHITPTDINNGIKYHVTIEQRMNLDNVYSIVNHNSGNWNSVYSTVETNSANWGGGVTGNFLPISTFQSYSGDISSSLLRADNVYTTVLNNSGSWGGGITGNFLPVTTFKSYSGDINPSLLNADNVYSTVLNNSGSWGGGITGNYISTSEFQSYTGSITGSLDNANNVYNTVESNSAYWNRNDINNDQTDSYQLQLSDAGKTIWMNKNTTNYLVIPTFSSVPFNPNTVIVSVQEGSGSTILSALPTVTVNGVVNGSGSIDGQYKAIQLINRSSNNWIIIGAIGTIS